MFQCTDPWNDAVSEPVGDQGRDAFLIRCPVPVYRLNSMLEQHCMDFRVGCCPDMETNQIFFQKVFPVLRHRSLRRAQKYIRLPDQFCLQQVIAVRFRTDYKIKITFAKPGDQDRRIVCRKIDLQLFIFWYGEEFLYPLRKVIIQDRSDAPYTDVDLAVR